MTKNITLAIDEDLLQRARVIAAIRRTSVNEMVREFLRREVSRETGQAGRAEIWSGIFRQADNHSGNRKQRRQADEPIFDREEFYEEVMRERGLL